MPKPDTPYIFKDPTTLTRWTKWLLYAGIALSVIGMVSGVMEYWLLEAIGENRFDHEAEMTAAAEANDFRQMVIGVAYIVLVLVTSVTVLMWIHRANRNAHALGAAGMRFTPGWAVGWYFIPILNLWKPYQAMKEIWKASANPRDWQTEPRSPLLPWWWFLWIAAGIFSQIVLRYSIKAEEIDELMTSTLLTVVSDALDIPLYLLLIAIIDRIWRNQMRHLASVPGGIEPLPASAVSPG